MPARLIGPLIALLAILTALATCPTLAKTVAVPRNWQTFKPSSGEFSAAMPSDVVRKADKRGDREFLSFTANEGHRVYAIFVGGYMGDSQKQTAEFEQGFIKGATDPLREQKRDVVIDEKPASGSGWTGKLLRIIVDKHETGVLILARGNTSNVAYALLATAPSDDEDVRSFISNFTVDNEKAEQAHSSETPAYKMGHALGYAIGFFLGAAVIVAGIGFAIVAIVRAAKKS